MNVSCLLSRFLNILFVICTGSLNEDTGLQRFSLNIGQKFKAELDYMEGDAASMIRCTALCTRNEGCMAASFNSDSSVCRLSEVHVDEPNSGQEIAVDTAWSALSKRVGPCLNGWSPVGQYCYLAVLEEKNVSDAKQICEQSNGWLAEPRDATMHRLLSNFLWRNYNLNGGYCIGLKSEYGNTTFVWDSDGQVPPYTKWESVTEPHTAYSINCVFQYPSGVSNEFKWADDNCGSEHRVLCQANWLD